MVCSGVYGARTWPGTAATHSQLAILAMGLLMIATGTVPALRVSLATCGRV